jgi:FtsP/CotA-like multicopper oxidase with cupredoxin domain
VPAWLDAGAATAAAELHLKASRGGPLGIAWTINGVAFTHEAHDHAEPIFRLAAAQFSRLTFVNDSARIHPMHPHGTFFKLLRRGDEVVDEPFSRDTVLLHARERVEIGLVPLDEGSWMMHCHILEHAESGMMTLFAVGG